MIFDDQALLEINGFCQALIDGVASAEERARLGEMLLASEKARRFYVRTMALSASLHEHAGEMQSEAPDARPGPANERPARIWWTVGSLAAAAAVALAFFFHGDGPTDEKDGDEWVARLSGGKNCEWVGAALRPGDELHRGQRLELAKGFAEITFDSGAQVTIEGPAKLDLTSEWETALDGGTMKANVPAEAIGFRVTNPAVDVIEAGTEFSMVADPRGATEVFVTKGAIEVQSREEAAREEPGLVLRENQARRFAGTAVSEAGDRDRKLARISGKLALDRLVRPAGYVHWSFDESEGASYRGVTMGAASGEYPAEILAEPGTDFTTPGRFRGGLRFAGSVTARAPLPEIAGRSARTAALWVKVPADAPLQQAGAILGWPLAGPLREVEIGWNRNPNQGALGALRTQAGRGYFVGTTPLRDGRWHHLAVVISPARKADGMQIRQYVDGRLEGVSAKRGGKRPNAKTVASNKIANDVLWIGRGFDGARFRGEIDELFLADRALAPQEIRQLMLRNQPALPEALAAN